MKKCLIVFGTRPEAIKLAPLIKRLEASQFITSRVCITGQHKEMLDQVLELFEISPDYNLKVMRENQSLEGLYGRIINSVASVLDEFEPDFIIVHGDTSTTFAAAFAAYLRRIKVAHIEAGLRTNDLYFPWPEEGNRMLTTKLADLHFAPTAKNKQVLISEGVSSNKIFTVGNTVIDALIQVKDKLSKKTEQEIIGTEAFRHIDFTKRIVLITGHRRENFGSGFESICSAVRTAALDFKDVEFVYPVHLNPNVLSPVHRILGELSNVHLLQPLSYENFVYLMFKSTFILTDSGGIQEEAPTFKKPVLVMRAETERQEAVQAGTSILVGTDTNTILKYVRELLTNKLSIKNFETAENPYGDGTSSKEIVKILERLYCAQ